MPIISPYIPLAKTLFSCSEKTWWFLRDAVRGGFWPREETLTENLIVQVDRNHRHEVRLRKFTVQEEGWSGGDWEWWFLASSGGHPFGIRIQAKKIRPDQRTFEGLRTSPGSQMNTLLKNSAKWRVWPAYVFYSYWGSSAKPPCVKWNCVHSQRYDPYLSIAIASAHQVSALMQRLGIKTADVSSLSAIMRPIGCLTCFATLSPKSDLADQAAAVAEDLSSTFSEAPSPVPRPDSLPDYVSRLLALSEEPALSEEARQEEIRHLLWSGREGDDTLSGLVIVSALVSRQVF